MGAPLSVGPHLDSMLEERREENRTEGGVRFVIIIIIINSLLPLHGTSFPKAEKSIRRHCKN